MRYGNFAPLNYLAHALLSGKDAELLIGNFIADHVRGAQLSGFPEGIRRGIMLHRQIDSFTDQHPSFRSAKRHFYTEFERHSGILVDIYFDHLLARDFETFSATPLQKFSANAYTIYDSARPYLPESSGRFLDYLLKNDLYRSYASIDGIERVLFHLSHRIGHGVRLDKSLPVFLSNESILQTQFTTLFELLIARFLKTTT